MSVVPAPPAAAPFSICGLVDVSTRLRRKIPVQRSALVRLRPKILHSDARRGGILPGADIEAQRTLRRMSIASGSTVVTGVPFVADIAASQADRPQRKRRNACTYPDRGSRS